MQSSLLHVAIAMDGNGRWARQRGLPRLAGHRVGAEAIRRTVEAAPGLGIGTLTLYAFSCDDWRRPPREVATLCLLFERYLESETPRAISEGVRIDVVGRRDRLSDRLLDRIDSAEAATARGRRLHLRLAVDCSASSPLSRDGDLPADRAIGSRPPAPDVDLLIRTSGEQRLSDLLAWEVSNSELVFTEVLWPDFGAADLAAAVAELGQRERRFARLAAAS